MFCQFTNYNNSISAIVSFLLRLLQPPVSYFRSFLTLASEVASFPVPSSSYSVLNLAREFYLQKHISQLT